MTTAIQLRELAAADADRVLDLYVACDIAEIGEPNTTIEEIRTDFSMPDLELVGVDGPGGRLTAVAWFEYESGHPNSYGALYVRPGADPTLLDPLMSWVRSRAAERAPHVPIWTFSDVNNSVRRAFLEAEGGVVIRRFYRMLIDLDAVPLLPVPPLAEGVVIRPMESTEADLRAMHHVVDTSFLDHFGHTSESYDHWLRDEATGSCPDHSLYWLATVDGEPAAGVYCCILPTAGHVDTLGTLREYRGRGLARALLLTAFAELYRRGHHRITLGVDATNPTGALALYESVGMRAQNEGWRYEIGVKT